MIIFIQVEKRQPVIASTEDKVKLQVLSVSHLGIHPGEKLLEYLE